MPLKVLPCTTLDYPRSVEVERRAWAQGPFTKILFPGPFPEDMAELRAQEIAKQVEEDPTTRWLKVVDTDLFDPDKGIAFAKWHVYADQPANTGRSRSFGEGCNIEACEFVFGGVSKSRDSIIGGKNFVYLAILATDPDHQRRGAAGLLVKWGVEEAKRYNLPLYVESSEAGHELYKKYGFKDFELYEIDMSKWGIAQPHRSWGMVIETEAKAPLTVVTMDDSTVGATTVVQPMPR
ncbi:hypothetical protein LTR05_006219 [Lithohypha guttulata]|uniref:N-acetyltransferase domain-containing protein n=1 Tax=Lithohypha guttulata TaxID=1690604 RepID=A0AAN7SXM3_9EURO|nr:hypothetical protein LTR05_006219 [Lithohypha guttulata]